MGTGMKNSVGKLLSVVVREVTPTSTFWFAVLGVLAVEEKASLLVINLDI